MDEYRHHVSGFFAHREQAESALSRLVEQGLREPKVGEFGQLKSPICVANVRA